MQMTLVEIADTAQSLAGQYESGLSAVESAKLMEETQPGYEEFWIGAGESMSQGRRLSECLEQVWPESLVSVLRAGEQSGSNGEVLSNIEEMVRMDIGMGEDLWRMRKPAGIFASGLSAFLFMMLYVIPTFNGAVHPEGYANVDGFTALSMKMNAILVPIWTPVCVIAAIVVFIGFRWMRSDAGKNKIRNALLSLPFFGKAIREFHYAMWAKQMSLMDKSGIALIEALSITRTGLPARLRLGVDNFERDLVVGNIMPHDACDDKNWEDDDQRFEWPFYLTRAFRVGSKTGKTQQELANASKQIMKYSKARFEKAIVFTTNGALVMSAVMVLFAALALFIPILTSLNDLQ